MSSCLTSLSKSEDPAEYARKANNGMMLGFPVSISGQSHRPDNSVQYHSTIKVFKPQSDHMHAVHQLAQNLPLNPPDTKTTQIEPSQFKGKNGDDIFVIKLHGNSAEKLKEHHGKFAHMGDQEPYAFEPHISVDKATWDKIKASDAKTAHEAGIKFGNAELKRGPKTIKTYRHEPDSAEPKVPDEGDLTAKIPYEPQFNKSESGKLIPLMKPYVSDAQRRWAHTENGKKALGGEAGVHEWDEATKGKKLPERVAKSENLIPAPSEKTHKELILHHGTKSKAPFEHFDMKHHASGFYPGIYTSSDPKETEKHGSPVKVGFRGHLFEIKDHKHADQLHQHAGGGGSGHKLVQKLKEAGYHGIKRGNEHIIFNPEQAKIQKSESEHPLEKGLLQNAGTALGMTAALAGGAHPASGAAKGKSPASIQQPKHNASPYNHQKMLSAIAQVESANGTNINHKPASNGEVAYGKYALMPNTIHDTIKGHRDLASKYGKALALKGPQLHRYMQDNPGLEGILADRHLSHIEHKLGQNPDLISYGWLNGIQGALNAKNNKQDISKHWHVSKVRDAYGKGK